MKKSLTLAAAALFGASLAAPLFADVTPADVDKAGNDAAKTINKNTHEAVKKVTATDKKAAAPKKKHSFFSSEELHKDRSLPKDDKVPMTDDSKKSDPPYKHLGSELHKERS